MDVENHSLGKGNEDIHSFSSFQVRVGRKIKLSRERVEMTQEELAVRAGVSVNVVSRLERGIANPRLSTLFKMSTILDIPIAELAL